MLIWMDEKFREREVISSCSTWNLEDIRMMRERKFFLEAENPYTGQGRDGTRDGKV